MTDVPKATLYTFDRSVWASSPRLTLVEKGYSASDVDLKIVDLLKGENFDPSYLRINSKATVPTLVVPILQTTSAEVDTKFRAITDTKLILEFLDKSRSSNTVAAASEGESAAPAPILAPATIEGKAVSDEIIRLVHDAKVDPNFLLLGIRNQRELEKAKSGIAGVFVRNRYQALLAQQKALESSNASTTAFDGSANPKSTSLQENLKKWYADKLDSQALLTNVYVKGDAQSVQQLVELTNATWTAVGQAIAELEAKVQGPFCLGDQICLADLHLIPWLASIGAIAQGLVGARADAVDGVNDVLHGFGAHVGDKVRILWNAFTERDSYKKVYADGLH